MRRLLLFLLGVPALIAAQNPTMDSTVVDTIAPGLVHTYAVRGEGPWRLQVLRIDLHAQYAVRSVRALDSLRGRETVTAMVDRARRAGHKVRAAINADFFDLKTGESVNNQVSDGQIWRALAWSGAPHVSMKSARGQFGITRDGRPVIERFVFAGTVRAENRQWALDGVNVPPANEQGLVLWTHDANGRTRADSANSARELRVELVSGSWRDSLTVRPLLPPATADSEPLRPSEAALVAYGAARFRLDSILANSAFTVHPRWMPGDGVIEQLIGGWPVVLRDNISMVERSASQEFTAPSNANARHPRSLIGFDADTSHLFLVVIDGRSAASVGVTLAEAAALLRELGVSHALNLDGGGSSALWLNGRIVNTPSDKTGERPVANALLIETIPRRR